jgi:hypothetical protein
MRVCESCGDIVPCLLNRTIAVGLDDRDWATVQSELCHKCAKKLDKMEVEARDYATLKAHWEFLQQMDPKGYEILYKRPARRIRALP